MRAAELVWRPPLGPSEWRSIGLFRAANEAELREVLASLPLHIWMKVTITPLTPHPNDPEHRNITISKIEFLNRERKGHHYCCRRQHSFRILLSLMTQLKYIVDSVAFAILKIYLVL